MKLTIRACLNRVPESLKNIKMIKMIRGGTESTQQILIFKSARLQECESIKEIVVT